MINKFTYGLVVLLLFALLLSCSGNAKKVGEQDNSHTDPSESLVKANRYLVKAEEEAIQAYIRRHQWQMEETGSGLRYWIYEKGSGNQAEKGNIVQLKYKVWLINGDLVYSSETDGTKVFRIGRGGVESGLEEAVLMMRKGDKARLILPSHLAYGLLGDEKKIPPRTPIVYEMEIINLN